MNQTDLFLFPLRFIFLFFLPGLGIVFLFFFNHCRFKRKKIFRCFSLSLWETVFFSFSISFLIVLLAGVLFSFLGLGFSQDKIFTFFLVFNLVIFSIPVLIFRPKAKNFQKRSFNR